jgi:hypothetical protein
LGYDGWKDLKDAGRRWIAEIVFSAIKRVFGEDLLSKKFSAQKIEAGLKRLCFTINIHGIVNTNKNQIKLGHKSKKQW